MACVADGKVYMWGANQMGQLGINSANATSGPVMVDALGNAVVVSLALGDYHSGALTDGVPTCGLEEKQAPCGRARVTNIFSKFDITVHTSVCYFLMAVMLISKLVVQFFFHFVLKDIYSCCFLSSVVKRENGTAMKEVSWLENSQAQW